MPIKDDLAAGKEAEQRVIHIFQQHGHEAMFNPDVETRSFYDLEAIIVGENDETIAEITLEVKNDIRALKSGNIAIEIYNPKANKASGLSITQADLWVIMVGEELWITHTKHLESFVATAKPFRIIDCGGDKNAHLYLYKKEHIFRNIFHRFDTLTKEQFFLLILELLS